MQTPALIRRRSKPHAPVVAAWTNLSKNCFNYFAQAFVRSCSVHLFFFAVRPRHSAPSPAPLAEGFRANCLQVYTIQMPSLVCTVVPRRWTVSSGGRQGSSATPFCLVFITDRRPHSTIHRRGPSLSGCRCSLYLERFTPARHFCTFVACLPVTPQDSYFPISYPSSWPVTMYRARIVTLHFGHVNRSCYLLTYLLCIVAFWCKGSAMISAASSPAYYIHLPYSPLR